MQCRQLRYSSTIIDLLPLLSPALRYILLTTKKLQQYDLLFASTAYKLQVTLEQWPKLCLIRT